MPLPPSGLRCRVAPALAIPLAALCWAVPRPAAACGVELGDEAPAAWRDAASALQRELAGDDCANIELAVAHDATALTLVLTTRDGRRAARTLGHPDELSPTVAALLVTTAEAVAPARPVASAQPAPAPRGEPRASERAPAVQSTDTQPTGAEAGPIFALSSGTRGGGDALWSPVLGGSASLLLDRWELGVTAAFEFQYFDLQDHRGSDRKSSAITAGVSLGRREPLGAFALLYAGRLSIVALLHDDGDHGQAEGRAGVLVGLSLPRTAGFRIRADVGADVVAGMNRFDEQTPVGASSGPITPEWAVTAMLGGELGAP